MSELKTEQPIGPATSQAFARNPAHTVGTCAKCGAEMRYNVPRLGPDGGYVHAANGGLDCFANELTIQIKHYIATATPEQIEADLKAVQVTSPQTEPFEPLGFTTGSTPANGWFNLNPYRT